MKRKCFLLSLSLWFLCPLLTRVTLAAETNQIVNISGTVYDPSGAVIPEATVSLANDETGNRQTLQTDAKGEYVFRGLPAGLYQLEVTHPGFERKKMALQAKSDQRAEVVLPLGSVRESVNIVGRSSSVPRLPRRPSPIRVGGDVLAGKLLRHESPSYPESARTSGIEGLVVLRAIIQADGRTGSLTVLKAPDPELADAALKAVAQWVYSPTLLNGQPVEVEATITVNFKLD